jgi:hypothetical protein
MLKLSLRAIALSAVTFVLTTASTLAQTGPVARVYVFKARPGMDAQLETAVRQHAQWRKANHDPWTWNVYTSETGVDIGTFFIRSSGHSWADFDAYDRGFGPQGIVQFTANVTPLIESAASTIEVALPDSMNQLPPAGTASNLVTLTLFHIKAGMEPQFVQLAAQAVKVLKAAKWPGNWVWVSPVSGEPEPGPVVILASLYENWAAMQDPSPDFPTVMTKGMGQNGFMKWNESLNATLRSTSTMTLRFRPDLSVLPN